MAGVNKVIIVGSLGKDPEIRTMNNGDRVASLSVATSESWRDKASGERKEKTEWHRVVCFNDNLTNVCENYLKKGSTVYLEGKLATRKYEQNGVEKYTTEVVLDRFGGVLTMLDKRQQSETGGGGDAEGFSGPAGRATRQASAFDDGDIPFVSRYSIW